MVERSLWEREVPGSSPGAPIFLGGPMPTKIFKQAKILPAYTLFLDPSDFKILRINNNLQVYVSKPIKAPFEFDSLVPSLNIIYKSKEAAALVQVAIKTERGWSDLYKLFYLSKNYKKTFSNLKDNFIIRQADTILPKSKATVFKLQITLLGKANINLVTATLTNKNIKHNNELSLEGLGNSPKIFDSVYVSSPIRKNILAVSDSVMLFVSGIYETIISFPFVAVNG